MRVPQISGTRGSLKWIQRLVEYRPAILDDALRRAGALPENRTLQWKSPLHNDQYAEYRDERFLEKLGLERLIPDLAAFWPRGGPQWDALATDGSARVFLFEAKAHGPEMHSDCKASVKSRELILASCLRAKALFEAAPNSDWLTGYYQYANRLAHLAFLQNCGVDAWLVFIYFMGDKEMGGPSSEDEWEPSIIAAAQHLGLRLPLSRVVSVYQRVDVL